MNGWLVVLQSFAVESLFPISHLLFQTAAHSPVRVGWLLKRFSFKLLVSSLWLTIVALLSRSRLASGYFSISPVLCLLFESSGALSFVVWLTVRLAAGLFASLCRWSSFNFFRNSRSITCKWTERDSGVIWNTDCGAEMLFRLIEFFALCRFPMNAFSRNELNSRASDRFAILGFDLFA